MAEEQTDPTFIKHTDEAIAMSSSSPRRNETTTPIDLNAVRAARQQDAIPDAPTLPKFSGRQVALGVAAAVGIVGLPVAGVTALAALEGGSEHGNERGEAIHGEASITLSSGANLRYDPFVGEGDNYNNVLHLEEPVTINAISDLRHLDGTDEGTWYGIPAADIKEFIPSIDISKDKDQMIWVNEQGVEIIQATDTPPAEANE